jgi:hypothetical protein
VKLDIKRTHKRMFVQEGQHSHSKQELLDCVTQAEALERGKEK